VRTVTDLVGLTAAQTFDAVRRYAGDGGVGPRLYDRLIGEAAVAHGLARIITWNVTHMRRLFPGLTVVTPAELLGAPKARPG
jgi:predicted nucleic acid-binding protein